MADTKISDLTAASALTGTEEFPLSDGTTTTKAATATQIKTFVNTAPVFAAGSASAGTWPTLTSGTLLTTAEDGAIEKDSNAVYMTTDAGNRGALPIIHLIRADSSRALANATGDQAIFNSPTNGRLTLETGCYFFEALVAITGMSATSGNAYFDLQGGGTAVLGTILYGTWGRDNALDAAGGALGGTASTAAQTNAAAVTAGTATAMWMHVRGSFEVTTAGTIQPSIGLQTASAATVSAGSYFMCNRFGSTSLVSIGQWD